MCKNMDNLNIGGVPLKSHAVLAPMAGVSDRAYRELCVRFGAAYCVSEMVSSKALSFNSKKSEELMEISDLERPCGIQIFGDDPKCMRNALDAPEHLPGVPFHQFLVFGMDDTVRFHADQFGHGVTGIGGGILIGIAELPVLNNIDPRQGFLGNGPV